MKAEERKELETNVLADRVGKMVQSVKGGPSRQVLFWVVIIAVVAVALFLYFRMRTQRGQEAAKAWLYLGIARQATPDQRFPLLQETMTRYGKDKSGLGAQVSYFWMVMDKALHDMRRGTVIEALELLQRVDQQFSELDARLKEEPVLKAEVGYHRAVIAESCGVLDFVEGKLEAKETWGAIDPNDLRGKYIATAKELFEKVTNLKDTPYADMAKKRLESRYADEAQIDSLRATYRQLASQMRLEGQIFESEIRRRVAAKTPKIED